MDSLRLKMSAEADTIRLGFGQVSALTILSALTADVLHGIEVYRSNEVPPASLGAWFGMTKSVLKACGTVAVWTKAGAKSVISARSNIATGRAIQVISGTLVDFDTGSPLPGRPVSLLSEGRDRIGSPVVTDERGDFTLRTNRAGELRLIAHGQDYSSSPTPVFRIAADEMIVVKLFVSAHGGVLAPLGIAARVLPQHIGLASFAGFTYRRERAQGGVFLRAIDIETKAVRSFADLVGTIQGVSIADEPAPGTIVFPRTGAERACVPDYYLDGAAVTGNAQATIAAIPLDRIFGVEIYHKKADIPGVFGDAGGCGVIVVWRKK
jgi:hypothetical protein